MCAGGCGDGVVGGEWWIRGGGDGLKCVGSLGVGNVDIWSGGFGIQVGRNIRDRDCGL